MKTKILALAAIFAALIATTSHAAPMLFVTPTGLDPGNDRLWDVSIAPDPALLPGSMAVELAFAIDDTELLGVDVNAAAWDHENPGNNPFTGTATEGLWLDLIGDRTFGAFGSVVFTTPGPVRLFTIETAGSGLSTIRYGEAASGSSVLGARIAQAGQNFDGYTGSATVPEPASFVLIGSCATLLAFAVRQRRGA